MVSSPPMTVKRWASAEHPFLFEINTWAWLEGLSADANGRIDLGSVPEARVGRDRRARLRRRVAHGRLDAQPGRCGRRQVGRGAVRELRRSPSRLPPGGCGRLAVLRPRIRRRSAPRRPGRSSLGSRRARAPWARPRARLRPEPRRPRPPVDRRPPRAVRPGNRGRPRGRSTIVHRGGGAGLRARSRSVLSRVARRRAAERLLGRIARRSRRHPARHRRSVRRRPLRHGDARDERHLHAYLG